MTKDDDIIPSGYTRVTEILSPFNDFSNIDPLTLANAADRGQRVHRYCELYSRSLLIEEPTPDCKPYVDSFIAWFDSYVEDVIYSEIRINCAKYKLSGRLDDVFILKGDTLPILIDKKTPQNPSKSWELQTAAYRILLREELGFHVERRACIILDKFGGKARFNEHTNHSVDETRFLNALDLHRFFKS
jgi:hypothetical protein